MIPITSVWSSFGHHFYGRDSGSDDYGLDECQSCGAHYELHPDLEYDDSGTSGKYTASNGDDPIECKGAEARLSHGYERECTADNGRSCQPHGEPCEHTSHDCNCVQCQ